MRQTVKSLMFPPQKYTQKKSSAEPKDCSAAALQSIADLQSSVSSLGSLLRGGVLVPATAYGCQSGSIKGLQVEAKQADAISCFPL